jgi:hypothetical protein
MFAEAVRSGPSGVVRMALRELSALPDMGAAIDPKPWLCDEDPEVRAAARMLDRGRREQRMAADSQ